MRHLLLALILAIASPAFAQSTPLPPAFEQLLRDYERAWVAKDLPALAALFAADGMALPNGQPPAQGAAAIMAAYQRGAGSPLALRALQHGVDGSLGYLIGGFAPAADQPDFGKFVLLLRREADGRWRILADMDNPNAMPRRSPPPAPAASVP